MLNYLPVVFRELSLIFYNRFVEQMNLPGDVMTTYVIASGTLPFFARPIAFGFPAVFESPAAEEPLLVFSVPPAFSRFLADGFVRQVFVALPTFSGSIAGCEFVLVFEALNTLLALGAGATLPVFSVILVFSPLLVFSVPLASSLLHASSDILRSKHPVFSSTLVFAAPAYAPIESSTPLGA